MNKYYLYLSAIAMALLLPIFSNAQQVFRAKKINEPYRATELQEHFENYELYKFNPRPLREFLDTATSDLSVNLLVGDDIDWTCELIPFDMYHEDAIIRVATENGEEYHPVSRNVTFLGAATGSHEGLLKAHCNIDYLRVYVDDGNDKTHFSPLRKYIPGAPYDYFVKFNESEALETSDSECGVPGFASPHDEEDEFGGGDSRMAGECFEASMGIAHDYAMYVDRGSSVLACELHAIDVMVDVAVNYEFQGAGVNFNAGLSFNILEQFVSTCSTCDPWTGSNDASELLNDFRLWGTNNFQNNVNFGQLWTDRDLTFNGNSSTVGLASTATGLMCNNQAYHILENYTANEAALRVLTAHEIGHNLGLQHDSDNGFIMSPSVNITNTWSTESRANGSIEIAEAGANCLNTCFSANFTSDICLGYGNTTITFTDLSASATDWFWDFGDGNTSTFKDPTHTYTSPGVYDVSLTINNGESVITKNAFIKVLAERGVPYTLADGGNMENDDFIAAAFACSDDNFIWEKGVPSGPYFSNSAGNDAWVTNLGADIRKETAQSYVYSPQFDFSTPGVYTVSFLLGMERYFVNAPFAIQIQYSLDEGITWTRLGDDLDENWYNRGPSQNFEISSVIFQDRTGWLFTNQGRTYSYDVSFLADNSTVAFRMVYSVSGLFNEDLGYQVDGAKFDDFAINFEPSNVLPIELMSFEGEAKNGKTYLTWQTSTETNNEYFMIERSMDGRNYETVGMVDGAGTTLEPQFYKLEDNSPSIGTNYYRLTQFDFDGNHEIADRIVAVDFSGNVDVKLQPNPAKGDVVMLTANYTGSTEPMEVAFFNAAGSMVKQFRFADASSQTNFDLPINELQKGVYFVQVNVGSAVQSLRLVIAD